MTFLVELKRRNVFRVAAAYLVAGWLVTEVLTTLLPTLGAPDWMSRAVVLVFALGFLPTVILAWVYQITPEGIRKQSELDFDDSLAARRGRRLEILTVAIVLLGILFLAVFGSQREDEVGAPATAAVPPMSIAVLPFVNMSDSQDNEYFSDGLTETLLHMLAQFPDLKVAARTSSFAFKNRNLPIGEIAAALGVAHILEGSVQRAGNRVRITAQLIRSHDQFHVWSANYDRTLDDIFAIQDEIAEEVGTALSESILGVAPAVTDRERSTSDTDAYDLYLQALQQRSTFSHWGLRLEQDLLKGALAVDPDFVDAKLGLAYNYMRQAETGLMEPGQATPLVQAIVEQVLASRPQDADARAIRLFIGAALHSGKVTAATVQSAISGLREIVIGHPDKLEVRLLLVRLMSSARDYDNAEVLLNAALQADPLNPAILYQLGVLHLNRDDRQQAEDFMKRSLEIEPRQPNAHSNLATMKQAAGDAVGTARHMLTAIEIDPTDHELSAQLANFLYELGLIEEADDFRKRVHSIAPTSNAAYQIDMRRALVTGDDEALANTARDAIRKNIDNRRNAYVEAVRNLLRVAIRRGTIAAELAFIEGAAPGLLDSKLASPSMLQWSAQFAAIDAWYVYLPEAEMQARIEALTRVAATFGLSFDDTPNIRFTLLAIRGQDEPAIKLALDSIFNKSVLPGMGWPRLLNHEQYARIVADKRVQKALQKWAAERERAKTAVAKFLQEAGT